MKGLSSNASLEGDFESTQERALALIDAGVYEDTMANTLKAVILKASEELLERLAEVPADRLAGTILAATNVHQTLTNQPRSIHAVIGVKDGNETLSREELIKRVNGSDRTVIGVPGNESQSNLQSVHGAANEVISDSPRSELLDSNVSVAHTATPKGHNNPSPLDSAHIKSTGKTATTPVNTDDA